MRSDRLASIIAVLALVVAAMYLVRTPPVIGHQVASLARKEAKKRGADLVIQSVRPHGLIGLTLGDVWLRVPRGDWALEIHFDEVIVTPSILSLLVGKVDLGDIEASHGRVRLIPRPLATIPKVEPASAPPAIKPSKVRSSGVPRSRPEFSVTLVDVMVDAQGTVATAQPLKIGRADFVVRDSQIHGLSGYATLPDGVQAAAKSHDDGAGSRTIVKLDRPTQLDSWLKRETPIRVIVGGFEFCSTCAEVLRVRDLVMSPRKYREDFSLSTTYAALSRDQDSVELLSPEMELEHINKAGFGARIMRTRVGFDTKTGYLRVRSRLADPQGGTLDIDAAWDDSIDATVFGEDFDSSSLADFVEIERFHPGILDGSIRIGIDIEAKVVEVETAIRLRDPIVMIARLNSEPLDFPSVGLNMHALADFGGRAFSVSQGHLVLGTADEIDFSGQLVDAGKGWRFGAHIQADTLDAVTFRDAMPAGIRDVAEGAILDGSFGFRLDVSGHTAYPKGLVLDGELHGDVAVLRDGAMDVHSLITNGPPPQLEKADLEHWRSYEDLPPHVPQVLLAAEDAAFFGHPGFDWEGLKAAMIHNLEAGSLERGGSTISQQVSKNLFLSPERTVARKLEEAYLTWRMEAEVPKERILEIYMNLANWGGVIGIERAAQRYFGVGADELTVPEVAMLAAILPNPSRFGGSIRKGVIDLGRAEKIVRILNNLRFLKIIDAAQYQVWSAEVAGGKIGRLQVEVK